MTDVVPGRADRLSRWFGPDGLIAGIAIDHRDAFIAAWVRRTAAPLERETVEALKARAIRALAPEATVVLLDHDYGMRALNGAAVPPDVALVMPLEEQGYEEVGDGRVTSLLEDFGPGDARTLGAAGCKLLLPYHPDEVESAGRQDQVTRDAVTACHAVGLPIVVEPIVYRLDAEPSASFEARRAERIATTAAHLATLGPDVLKLQFPTGTPDDAAACAELTIACGEIPWVLLGAGSDERTFARQLETAVRAGATGFIVGRTVWDGALTPDDEASERYLRDVAVPMFRRFIEVARSARQQ